MTEDINTSENKEQVTDSLGNSIPKNVYHYTDGRGLEGILRKNELWLSNREFLNDMLDKKHPYDLIAEKLKPRYQKCLNFEGSLIADSLLPHIEYEYIFSTSTKKDSIHQWSYYGSSDAYCIEFKTDELIKFFNTWDKEKIDKIMKDQKGYNGEEENLYFGDVIYDPASVATLHNASEKYEQSIMESIDSAIPNKKIDDNFRYAYHKFHATSSLIKQEGHSCENEFRFLIRTKYVAPDFRIRNGLFTPYITFSRKDSELKNLPLPIESISIGPMRPDELAEKGLRMFLKKIGRDDISVERSSLKMRF